MNKFDYLKQACKAGAHKRLENVIAWFAVTKEDTDKLVKELVHHTTLQTSSTMDLFCQTGYTTDRLFRPVRKDDGYYAFMGVRHGEMGDNAEAHLVSLESPVIANNELTPLFSMREPIELEPGDIPNLTTKLTSTVGNYLINWILLAEIFGEAIPYKTGKIKIKDIESIFETRLVDNPKPGETVPPGAITVKQLHAFNDAVGYVSGFSQLCVPAMTKKSMTPPPDIAAKRDKIWAQYSKEDQKDPAVVAKVSRELVALYNEWLKGDLSEGFLISEKSRAVVGHKLFLMGGAEQGVIASPQVDLVMKSFYEGLDPKKFATLNNVLIGGSYNRGKETELGGEAVKWLLRASSNIAIVMKDCGSRLGNLVVLTETNQAKYMGFSVVTPDGYEPLTSANYANYLNKKVMIRSPKYCKLTHTDYCEICCGPRLALHPTGVSSAISDYGSAFLYIFMKKVHGKGITTARLKFKESFI